MADEAPKAFQAPTLTPRDIECIVAAFRSPKTDGEYEIDYAKFAVLIGAANPAAARSTWHRIKKKIFGDQLPTAANASSTTATKPKTLAKPRAQKTPKTPKSETKAPRSDSKAKEEAESPSPEPAVEPALKPANPDAAVATPDGETPVNNAGAIEVPEDVTATEEAAGVRAVSVEEAKTSEEHAKTTITTPQQTSLIAEVTSSPSKAEAPGHVVNDTETASTVALPATPIPESTGIKTEPGTPTPAPANTGKKRGRKAKNSDATAEDEEVETPAKKPRKTPVKKAKKADHESMEGETAEGEEDAEKPTAAATPVTPKKRKAPAKKAVKKEAPADDAGDDASDKEAGEEEEEEAAEQPKPKRQRKTPVKKTAKKDATGTENGNKPKAASDATNHDVGPSTEETAGTTDTANKKAPTTPKTPRKPRQTATAKKAAVKAAEEAKEAEEKAAEAEKLRVQKEQVAAEAEEANAVLVGKKKIATKGSEQQVNGAGADNKDYEVNGEAEKSVAGNEECISGSSDSVPTITATTAISDEVNAVLNAAIESTLPLEEDRPLVPGNLKSAGLKVPNVEVVMGEAGDEIIVATEGENAKVD